jgi:hypothetical protein
LGRIRFRLRENAGSKPTVQDSIIAGQGARSLQFVCAKAPLTERFKTLHRMIPFCRRNVRVCGVDGGFTGRALSARFSGLKP